MNKKKALALVITFLLSMTMFPIVSMAADYSDGTYEYTVLGDSTLSITKYNGGGGDVTIPSSYDPGGGAIAVTTIGLGAFSGSAVTSVTVPSSVTSIEGSAFGGYPNLISVTLSEGLTKIEGMAFVGCSALETVNIPASVTRIDPQVFRDCDSLKNVTLSDGLTILGSEMFNRCTALESITIPSSVNSFGDSVFYYCTNLKNVTLSNGLDTIGRSMFVGCASLESITIPSSISSISNAAFANSGLKSITIPDTVTSMGTYVFNNCASLSSVTIGSGLTTMPENMLSFCTLLTSVTVPSNITLIDDDVFEDSNSLQRVVIAGKSVSFGEYTFLRTNLASDGIYGFSGSAVETYAGNNSIPFHALTEVTYDSQGGSDVPYDYVISQGDTVNAPENPIRTGFFFDGWYPTAACDTTAVTFPFTVNAETTLYAKWTPVYTVTFNSKDGSAVASQEVIEGNKATEPTDPTLSGHVFDGWYTDESFATAYDFSTAVTADKILYAKWTELRLSSSVSDGKIYTGGRIILTPSVDDGTWDWDNSFFTATFNSPATFTGLKAGTSTITYTVDGVSVSYDVTIEESALPNTGQNTYVIWVFIGTAGILLAVGTIIGLRKRHA